MITPVSRLINLRHVKRVDPAMADTVLASALNLLTTLIVGAIYGVNILGEFSLILIYSSFCFLFAYNFIIVPATSQEWGINKLDFAKKVLVISFFIFMPLTVAIILLDYFLFKFSDQNYLLTFFYIVSHNVFLTSRRIVLHLRIFKYPSLVPIFILSVMVVPACFEVVSYRWFILGLSVAYLIPSSVVIRRGSGNWPSLDFKLVLQFIRFSRWMALGVWFQWLSGNLVQLFVQHHSGAEALGELRVLLSSFGFLSIYFQYHEIVYAREHGANTDKEFLTYKKTVNYQSFIIPTVLVTMCLPVYFIYSYMLNIAPLFGPALVYALYQILVLFTITLRVFLRLKGDMSYTSIGYFLMVLTVILIEWCHEGEFSTMTAIIMYLASILVMTTTLILGGKCVSK